MQATPLEYSVTGSEAGPGSWDACVDALCAAFPRGAEQGILPTHFLRATLPRLGAKITHVKSGTTEYWGLLLPAGKDSAAEWTLRSHWLEGLRADRELLKTRILARLGQDGFTSLQWYDYALKSRDDFVGTGLGQTHEGLTICEPDRNQALEAQDLQRSIWKISDPAFLYPADLYRPDSGLASRLVAVDSKKVVGFLLGFYAIGIQWYGRSKGFQAGQWQESQLMGVQDGYRGKGIARKLKLMQRENALGQGLELIHWTVDPLQASNARLNFNSLGGVAIQHYRDHYPFRNRLNRVQSSRLGVSWLIRSPRAEEAAREQKNRLDYNVLAAHSCTEIITPVTVSSKGLHSFSADTWQPQSETILLEIPPDWNRIQRDNVGLAETWRNVSDALLSKILGWDQEPQYAVIGIIDQIGEDKAYLVIHKLTADLGV